MAFILARSNDCQSKDDIQWIFIEGSFGAKDATFSLEPKENLDPGIYIVFIQIWWPKGFDLVNDFAFSVLSNKDVIVEEQYD